MNNINENEFRNVDLNLLVVFAALSKERSVTRAAERLNLSQAAVSAALSRLRDLFKDELFVRTSHGMEPTKYSLYLAEKLGPPMQSIRDTLYSPEIFNPQRESRIFRLGMTDAMEIFLMPLLISRIHQLAPNIQFVIVPANRYNSVELLDQGQIDVSISVFPELKSWHRSEILCENSGFACLFDGKRLGLRAPLSLQDYLAMPHLLVSFKGDLTGIVDERLAQMNLKRRLLMVTSHFAAVPFLLKRIDAIATLPDLPAHGFSEDIGLTLSPVPIELEPVQISLIWHARDETESGHRWMREQIMEISRSKNH